MRVLWEALHEGKVMPPIAKSTYHNPVPEHLNH